MNARSLEYKALKRDADPEKTFYEELTKKINEAGINSGFQGKFHSPGGLWATSPVSILKIGSVSLQHTAVSE